MFNRSECLSHLCPTMAWMMKLPIHPERENPTEVQKRWGNDHFIKTKIKDGLHMLTCNSKPSAPSSWDASRILVLMFTGLHNIDNSPTATRSWEGHSQISFCFQSVCIYQRRNSVCLFRWDISLPLELQVTVNVTQVLFPVRKVRKNTPVNCLCSANCQRRFNLGENINVDMTVCSLSWGCTSL